ncbi:MAG: hypothetical protein IJH94_05275, partial [Clostridia bacterium]|nr:hypothetical protein [Clostridia bacterium]
SNMSGRGSAAEAVVCSPDAGFEFRAVSDPHTLYPVTEPFGLNEDRVGGICDKNSDGTTKRSGSMVSAAVDEYHKKTGRQLVAVSASIGGTNTDEWLKTYISDAASRLSAAKAFLERNGIGIGRVFVVWCQGESDGDAKTTAEKYTANLKEIYAEFSAAGAEKCFVIQTGHYNYVKYPDKNAGLTGMEWDGKYGVIRDAQAALCEADDNFVFAGSLMPHLDEMRDPFHYYQSAYNAVGTAAADAIAEYYRQ